MKILFKIKVNRSTNIIISCPHTAFNKLLKKGRFSINWERHNVREFIRPLQSFKCFKFGHLAKKVGVNQYVQIVAKMNIEVKHAQMMLNVPTVNFTTPDLVLNTVQIIMQEIKNVVFLFWRLIS